MAITKHAQNIQTMDDWLRLAPPKSLHHWESDRSAMEVARAWLAGGGKELPPEVHAILATNPLFGSVLSWDCEPEARLPFDDFAGEPRNSDLCVAAVDAYGPYVLAVEAKADEPYGETVAETFAAALERRIENPRSNGVARIAGLAALLLHPAGDGESRAAGLRYQLLTACAGVVAEAGRRKTSRAVMLVHEFVTPKTADRNHERNTADLGLFLGRLGHGKEESVQNDHLYGPFEPPGAPGIDLFIGKVTRNLRH